MHKILVDNQVIHEGIIDLVGVGIGPFNLSLAALLEPIESIKAAFFDKNDKFNWHPGMLLSESDLQVSYLKDLVTPVDPTNPHSFIAFIVKHKRLYRFLNARFPRVRRVEFNQYLQWVTKNLPHLYFDEKIKKVHYFKEKRCFAIETAQSKVYSRHLVLGSGLTPHLPACLPKTANENIFHSQDFSFRKKQCVGKRVIIVGGGQSGAEVFDALLSDPEALPAHVTWVTSREQFYPMDDSTFANELFTPNHTQAFYELSDDRKKNLLSQYLLASDGISASLLESIYRKLYTLDFLSNQGRLYELLPHHVLTGCALKENFLQPLELCLHNQESRQDRRLVGDVLILCTGYRHHIPKYLDPIQEHLVLDQNHFKLNKDFSIVSRDLGENKIYVQNAGRHSHGVADPNLSLMAWRSATIINSIAKQTIYDLETQDDSILWSDIYASAVKEKSEAEII